MLMNFSLTIISEVIVFVPFGFFSIVTIALLIFQTNGDGPVNHVTLTILDNGESIENSEKEKISGCHI